MEWTDYVEDQGRDVFEDLSSIDHSEFAELNNPSTIQQETLGPGTDVESEFQERADQLLVKTLLLADEMPPECFETDIELPPRPRSIRNGSEREKIAELFPSDSDLSSYGMMDQIRESGSSRFPSGPHSLSRPSSVKSENYYNRESKSRRAIVIGASSFESLNLSSKIDKIHKATSKRAVRSHHWHTDVSKRLGDLEGGLKELKDMVESKVEQITKVSRWLDQSDHLNGAPPLYTPPPPQIASLAWAVPYAELKHHGMICVTSSTLHIPQAGSLQAELYLKGIGNGHGSHLSITPRWTPSIKGLKRNKPFRVIIIVEVLNQIDPAETIEKRLPVTFKQQDDEEEFFSFKNANLHQTIQKLIPISSIEDASLGYMTQGVVLLNFTAEY